MKTNRRSFAAIVAAAPVAILSKAAAAIRKPHDVVRQAELQECLDMYSRLEIACANIRRRLDAGVPMERGALGVSTIGQLPLDDFDPGGTTSIDAIMGLEISPVEDLQRWVELEKKFPLNDDALLLV